MAFLDQEFDVKNMPESSGDFEPLPAGTYSARITSVDLKDTKAGNGQYLALRFDITGPTHQGRVVFSNLNTLTWAILCGQLVSPSLKTLTNW